MLFVPAAVSAPPAIVIAAGEVADAPQGTAVVAKASGDALVIWDAAAMLKDLRARKTSDADTLRALEAAAAAVLANKAPALASAQTVAVRVVYPRSAEFNPKYGVEVVSSVERLMTLKASRDAIVANGRAWPATLRSGGSPSGLTVTVTGKLPPPT